MPTVASSLLPLLLVATVATAHVAVADSAPSYPVQDPLPPPNVPPPGSASFTIALTNEITAALLAATLDVFVAKQSPGDGRPQPVDVAVFVNDTGMGGGNIGQMVSFWLRNGAGTDVLLGVESNASALNLLNETFVAVTTTPVIRPLGSRIVTFTANRPYPVPTPTGQIPTLHPTAPPSEAFAITTANAPLSFMQLRACLSQAFGATSGPLEVVTVLSNYSLPQPALGGCALPPPQFVIQFFVAGTTAPAYATAMAAAAGSRSSPQFNRLFTAVNSVAGRAVMLWSFRENLPGIPESDAAIAVIGCVAPPIAGTLPAPGVSPFAVLFISGVVVVALAIVATIVIVVRRRAARKPMSECETSLTPAEVV